MRFCTCSEMPLTSKLGLPEANSITAFWRCCCSGTCSAETLMPVSSVNSFSAACIRSERGFLTSSTSIDWPENFFQSNAPCACALRSTKGEAIAAAPPASRTRRVGLRMLSVIGVLPRT